MSTYNDDSYNENIYNKSYSREFISLYVSISFLYFLNYILSIYCLCSENCQLNQKYPILDIIFAFSHQLYCCKFTYIVGRNTFFINQRSEKIDISKAELILFSVHEGHNKEIESTAAKNSHKHCGTIGKADVIRSLLQMSGHSFLQLYHGFCADVVGLMKTYYSVADYPEVLCLKKRK